MELERIRTIIAEQFSISMDKITENTSFLGDLNADSLDLFQLITALEEEFSVEFPSEQAEKIKTVKDAVELLKKMN